MDLREKVDKAFELYYKASEDLEKLYEHLVTVQDLDDLEEETEEETAIAPMETMWDEQKSDWLKEHWNEFTLEDLEEMLKSKQAI